MPYLYPRLTNQAARKLIAQKAAQPPAELRDQHSTTESLIDNSALYAPTGGHRAEPSHLRHLRETVRECSNKYGFPGASTVQDRLKFDTECSRILHELMDITPSEASSLGVWMHMTCSLLPDVVRWRFPGEGTTESSTNEDRFIGRARGLGRNAFGRLWWRGYLLHESGWKEDPYFILTKFGEDDLVQITERPSLAGNPELAKQIFIAFLDLWPQIERPAEKSVFTERMLFRDTVKRILRLLPITAFEALDPDSVKSLVQELIVKSASSFRTLSK